MFTRKEYATSVSGKTANGCPVRSAEPPDNMDFHFISPCGAKLYEVFHVRSGCSFQKRAAAILLLFQNQLLILSQRIGAIRRAET